MSLSHKFDNRHQDWLVSLLYTTSETTERVGFEPTEALASLDCKSSKKFSVIIAL